MGQPLSIDDVNGILAGAPRAAGASPSADGALSFEDVARIATPSPAIAQGPYAPMGRGYVPLKLPGARTPRETNEYAAQHGFTFRGPGVRPPASTDAPRSEFDQYIDSLAPTSWQDFLDRTGLTGRGEGAMPSLARGWQSGVSGMYQTLANLADLHARVSGDPGGPAAAAWFQERADRTRPTESSPTLAGKVIEGAGRAAVDIPQYILGGELLGPVKGMAVIGGLQRLHEGPAAAAEGAAEGALMGGTLHVTAPLTAPARAATLAAAGGAQSAIGGGSASDIAANAILQGALGLPGSGRVRLRDVPGMAIEHYLPGGDRAPAPQPRARLEPTLNVPPIERPPALPQPVNAGIATDRGAFQAAFPDQIHADLYRYGIALDAGNAAAAERDRLFTALRDWTDPPIGKPEDLDGPDGLAADYVGMVRDQAGAALQAGRPAGERLPSLIDPDLEAGYLRQQASAAAAAPRPAGQAAGGQQEASGAAPPSQPTPPAAAPESPIRKPLAPDEIAPLAPSRVVTAPGGRKIEVRPEVVDAGQLVASHGPDLNVNPQFPAELQPRDRSRAASEAQVGEIARGLDPSLLGDSPTTTDGAPIVGPDGVVESGNGRVLAIRRAYAQHPEAAARYRQFLEQQGHDLTGINEPVLIRRRVTELSPADRQAFALESNQRTTLSMGAAEQAAADARSMPPWLLDLYRGGDIATGANAEFVRRFADAVVPHAERGAFISPEGGLSQDGRRRIENALFAGAYGSPELLASLREGSDSAIQGIGNAMIEAAPAWAKLRADAAAGRVRTEMDITPALVEAANVVSRARRQGVPIADLVNQTDMLSGGVSPMARSVLRIMFRDNAYRRPASRQAVAGALRYYADQAGRARAGGGLDLGDAGATPQAILELAANRGSGDLLGTAAAESREVVSSQVSEADNIAQGQRAAANAMLTKRSVERAMHRDDVGWITFDYGQAGDPARKFAGGWGLSHIVARRTQEGEDGMRFVLADMPRAIAKGEIARVYGPENGTRVDIEHAGNRVTLSLHRHDQRETWVLTAFRKKGEGGSGEPEGVNPNRPYAGGPSGIQGRPGAEPPRNVVPPRPAGNPTGGRSLGVDEVNAHLAGEALPTDGTAEARQNMTPGANYVGPVRDRYDPQQVPTNNPVRRERILHDLIEGIGLPIYQGRIKSRGVLGFYRPHLGEIRIKRSNDLEVAIHEAAHALDDRYSEIRKQWTPASSANAAVRAELRGVSYDKSKLFEGFAEFLRLWATQPHEAQARAPIFSGWWKDFVERVPEGAAIKQFRDQATAWFNQAALDRARSKIGADADINAGLTRLWDRLRQSTVDDLHGIKLMEETLTGSIAPAGAYETARLTRAKASILQGVLELGAIKVNRDGSHEFTGKGLKQILAPVADRLDDWLMYAVGRSANELMAQGRERLFTRAEIQGMLALRTPEFDKAFQEYQDWNRAILDFAEAKGIIDPFARQFWQRNQYLPFHRVGQPGTYSKVQGDWHGIKALTGGTDNLRDVLGNMIGNATTLLDAALTNEARQKVAGLARQQLGARFMAKIPTEERGIKVAAGEVERAILEALGVTRRSQLTPEQQQVFDEIQQGLTPLVDFILRGQAPTGHNVVAVLDHGKPTYYEVADPIVLRALSALKRPPAPWIVRALSLPRRVGQASVTLSADFMAANILRDTVMGGIMSRSGFRPFIDSAIGLKSRLTKDQNYRDFIANGGGLSSVYMGDKGAKRFRQHLERFYGRKGINYRTVLDSPAKLLHGVETIADAFEMATRLGEFRRAVQRGENPRHAAYRAREVSTDFAMRGDSAAVGFLYDTVMFLKAGMVSLDRAYRGFAEDPNRARIAVLTGLLAMASAGLYAVNRSNPLYQQLEDWDRDSNWHFFVPKPSALQAWAEGRDVPPAEAYLHFRLPKLWEIGAFSSIAERGLQAILDANPGQGALDILRVIKEQFSLSAIPQALAPLYEVATNRDTFTGRPIITQAEKDLMPFAQAGSDTSETMRALGYAERKLPTALQVPPAQAEHLLRGYFNTWATYGLSLADAIGFDSKPDMRLDQMPVLRRFFSAEPARNSRYITELYDLIQQAQQARATMRHMDKTGQPDIATELESTPDNLAYGQMNYADQHMRAIRGDMEAVRRADSIEKVQQLAQERARQLRRPELVSQAKAAGAWTDMGALKRLLLDDMIAERNSFAETIVTDVRQHAAGAAR